MTTVRDVVASVINLPPTEPNAPGPFRYGEPGKLLVLLEHAGFADIQVSTWRGTLDIAGGLPAMEAADFALASFSSFGELLAKAGGETLSEARRSLTVRFSRHQQNDIVRMNACALIVTGTNSGDRHLRDVSPKE
jgi:hypothetical protein